MMGLRCFQMVFYACLGVVFMLLGPTILADNVNESGFPQFYPANQAHSSSIQANQGNSLASGNSEQKPPQLNNGPNAKPRPIIQPIETIQKRERIQPRQ